MEIVKYEYTELNCIPLSSLPAVTAIAQSLKYEDKVEDIKVKGTINKHLSNL